MMSHKEYVESRDEEQLENLIEQAQARLKTFKESGWVGMWCVVDDCIVRGRFLHKDHHIAVERLIEVIREAAPGKTVIDITLEHERVRPSEVEELLKEKYS